MVMHRMLQIQFLKLEYLDNDDDVELLKTMRSRPCKRCTSEGTQEEREMFFDQCCELYDQVINNPDNLKDELFANIKHHLYTKYDIGVLERYLNILDDTNKRNDKGNKKEEEEEEEVKDDNNSSNITEQLKTKQYKPLPYGLLKQLPYTSIDFDAFYNNNTYYNRINELMNNDMIASNELDWPFRLQLNTLHYCPLNQEHNKFTNSSSSITGNNSSYRSKRGSTLSFSNTNNNNNNVFNVFTTMMMHDNILPEIISDVGKIRLDFSIYDQGKCIDSCKSLSKTFRYDHQANMLNIIHWSIRNPQLLFKNNTSSASNRKSKFTKISNIPINARLAVILVGVLQDGKEEKKIGYGVIPLFDFNGSFIQGKKRMNIYKWDDNTDIFDEYISSGDLHDSPNRSQSHNNSSNNLVNKGNFTQNLTNSRFNSHNDTNNATLNTSMLNKILLTNCCDDDSTDLFHNNNNNMEESKMNIDRHQMSSNQEMEQKHIFQLTLTFDGYHKPVIYPLQDVKEIFHVRDNMSLSSNDNVNNINPSNYTTEYVNRTIACLDAFKYALKIKKEYNQQNTIQTTDSDGNIVVATATSTVEIPSNKTNVEVSQSNLSNDITFTKEELATICTSYFDEKEQQNDDDVNQDNGAGISKELKPYIKTVIMNELQITSNEMEQLSELSYKERIHRYTMQNYYGNIVIVV